MNSGQSVGMETHRQSTETSIDDHAQMQSMNCVETTSRCHRIDDTHTHTHVPYTAAGMTTGDSLVATRTCLGPLVDAGDSESSPSSSASC